MESNNGSQENSTGRDRKSMWKLLKQQKKEAKKKEREAEFLENLRKPKDTKVVLADKSFVEKLRNQNVSSPPKRTPGFLAGDFPALPPPASFPRPPPKWREQMAYSSAVNNSVANLHFPTVEETKEPKEKKVEHENNCDDSSSTIALAVTDNVSLRPTMEDAGDTEQIDLILSAPPTPRKRTKRKDPLVLYSHDLICKNSPKKDGDNMISGSKYRRKREVGVLCGNMLDSSNPIRKRGKHREIKKLRLSKLKFAIIRDRILKQKERNDSTGEAVMDRKQLKIEIDEYLSNLTKKKLELAEQRRKRCEENKTEEVIPEEVTPEGAIPEEVIPEEVIPEGEIPEEVTPEGAIPEEMTPEGAIPEEMTPEGAIPKGVVSKVIPEEVISAESKSDKKYLKKKPPKYRKYCDNGYAEGLDESVRNLITGMVYLQDRAFNKDEIKARAKQRHVVGLREVKKYLMLNKIKMVVLAPDLEAKDAVCNVIEDLKKTASLQNIPCVFALSRRMLGQATKKWVPVSAFGIMNYEGMEEKFVEVKENLKGAQDRYKWANCEMGNADSNSSEVMDTDGKIKDVDSSEKAVSLEKENGPVPHRNKKKRKSKKNKSYTMT